MMGDPGTCERCGATLKILFHLDTYCPNEHLHEAADQFAIQVKIVQEQMLEKIREAMLAPGRCVPVSVSGQMTYDPDLDPDEDLDGWDDEDS